MDKELITRSRALLNAVCFDSDGMMIGDQRQGGNGGLISLDTIRAADQLRLLLDQLDAAEDGAR